MLIENRKFLRWVVFPPPELIHPAVRTVYLQCDTRKWLITHQREEFISYVIDLDCLPEELLARYAPKLRQKIRKSRRLGITVVRDQDPSEVIRLFRPTAKAKGLNPIDASSFSTKPNLLVTRAVSPQLGTLAAHAYSLDPLTRRVRGLYNASAFRQFGENTVGRRQASLANGLLYHEDFLYFQGQGFLTYDFGGYGSPATGSTFKDQFRGLKVRQFNYYPMWYFAYRKLKQWAR